MIKTQEDLLEFIEDKAISFWSPGKPYYLSMVGSDARSEGIDYKDLINPVTLKQFVENSQFKKIRVEAHPTIKAKVALIPIEEIFSFSDVDDLTSFSHARNREENPSKPMRNSAATRILYLLSSLPEEDLSRIVIPIDVLIKLHVAK